MQNSSTRFDSDYFSNVSNLSSYLNHTLVKFSPEFNLPIFVFLTAFGIISIFISAGGNAMIILSVFSDVNLIKVQNNLFLVSLATSDFIVGIFVMPIGMFVDLRNDWIFSEKICKIWIFLDTVCATTSVLSICLITYDIYRHTIHVKTYDSWMTRSKAIQFVAAVWTFAFVMGLLPVFFTNKHFKVYKKYRITHTLQCASDVDFGISLISALSIFYIPSAIIIALSIKLAFFGRNHTLVIKYRYSLPRDSDMSSSSDNSIGTTRISSNPVQIKLSRRYSIWDTALPNYKAFFMVFILCLVFLVCWTPYFIINPMAAYDATLISSGLYNFAEWASYWSSCANAIILISFNKEFRNACINILRCEACCCVGRTDNKRYSFDYEVYIRVIKTTDLSPSNSDIRKNHKNHPEESSNVDERRKETTIF